jgi:glycosyltransferase involved in cell wall biosynthesis
MKVLLFANTDWYLYNFRLSLARALREAGAEVVLISPDGPYGSRLEAAGFRWLAQPMLRRSLNPFRELIFLFHLFRLYQHEQPDVVHHFTIKCVVYGSLAARLVGIHRRINAVAGMGYVFASNALRASLLRPFVRALLKLSLGGKQSRLILQNSGDCMAFVQSGLVTPGRLRLIQGSGINTDRFKPAVLPRQDVGVFRVLFAARLLWDKGIREYVEAAVQFKSLGFPVEFLLAGAPDTGNPASVPDDVVQSWQAAGLIRVLGHVEDMVSCLHQADLAVLPSYREGIPKSLLEAAACGLPIVTTDAPGCRDAIEDGVTGLLVPCRDVAALATAIRFMFEHPVERAQMGAAGRERVLRQFDEKIVLGRTLDVYRELVGEISA